MAVHSASFSSQSVNSQVHRNACFNHANTTNENNSNFGKPCPVLSRLSTAHAPVGFSNDVLMLIEMKLSGSPTMRRTTVLFCSDMMRPSFHIDVDPVKPRAATHRNL